MREGGTGKLLVTLSLLGLVGLLIIGTQAQGQETEVTSSFEDTGNIKSGDVKAYHFPGNDLYLELSVTTTDPVDFYIFTETGYNEYTDETSMYFSPEKTSEKKNSFRWSEKLTQGYYLVIDNAYVSESGAMPAGTVSYDISVGLDAVRPLNPLQENCFLIILIICAVIIAAIIWFLRSPRNLELPPPPVDEKAICPTCGGELQGGRCPVCQPRGNL